MPLDLFIPAGEKKKRERDRGEGKLARPGTMNLTRGNKSRIVASISTKLARTQTHTRAQLALLISSPNKSRLARGTRLRERVGCRPFT